MSGRELCSGCLRCAAWGVVLRWPFSLCGFTMSTRACLVVFHRRTSGSFSPRSASLYLTPAALPHACHSLACVPFIPLLPLPQILDLLVVRPRAAVPFSWSRWAGALPGSASGRGGATRCEEGVDLDSDRGLQCPWAEGEGRRGPAALVQRAKGVWALLGRRLQLLAGLRPSGQARRREGYERAVRERAEWEEWARWDAGGGGAGARGARASGAAVLAREGVPTPAPLRLAARGFMRDAACPISTG